MNSIDVALHTWSSLGKLLWSCSARRRLTLLLLAALLSGLGALRGARADNTPPNQAPMIYAWSLNGGQGYWEVNGTVGDDQNPYGYIVTVWGPALGQYTEITSVMRDGTFSHETLPVGPGQIYVQTVDAQGAKSNIAMTYVGY
jgi:hypothetical protein